jgi:mannose-1-phosphate guanylyltransferase/mannose-6-phosphate isomerase
MHDSPIDVSPVILCGGIGSRLWPLSRAGFPKQFLCLTGAQSLFQLTATRLSGCADNDIRVEAPVIVCNEEHRFLVLEQMREIGCAAKSVILEPEGRNTAPALTLAALHAVQNGDDPVLVVSPADQSIADDVAYTVAVRKAVVAAAEGVIVILGIRPTRPETGFGYIKAGAPSREHGSVISVERFTEKPDVVTAAAYLAEGGFFWNGGVFVLRASTWLKALAQFRQDIFESVKRTWASRACDAAFVRPGPEFAMVPSESIDYAVAERCAGSNVVLGMVTLDAGWNDLGTWDAVWSVLPKDKAGNVTFGDAIIEGCRSTMIHATSRLVSAIGLEDVIIVETPDAVMVSRRELSQEVGDLVKKLNARKRQESVLHRKVHRPWGWYDCVEEGARFKVKRILVNPGESLSLQKHNHRAEHWIVVNGVAEITNGDRTIVLTENQSTYIPIGERHRLRNPGASPLEIIEVQSGNYLGEDDIVRLKDNYGRSQ